MVISIYLFITENNSVAAGLGWDGLGWLAGLVAAMDIAMWREDWRLMAEGILWSYVETLSTIQ